MHITDSIKRKSLLYKSGVNHTDYCINHVEGCSHGCKYPCYAFLMKKRWGVVKSYEEWCHPKIVSNAFELLEKEIPKLKNKIKSVHLCFSTDPFMYNRHEVTELSLKIIHELNRNDIPVSTLTKGITPEELADSNQFKQADNDYGITLVSLDEDLRKNFEPNSAPFYKRIHALRLLHERGCRTYVTVEPYPTPNLVKQNLKEILEAISFADRIIFGRMNYSRHVTEYKEYKGFYNEMARFFIGYCEERGIGWYLKEKTLTEGESTLDFPESKNNFLQK